MTCGLIHDVCIADGFRMDGRRWKVNWADERDFQHFEWKWFEAPTARSPPRQRRCENSNLRYQRLVFAEPLQPVRFPLLDVGWVSELVFRTGPWELGDAPAMSQHIPLLVLSLWAGVVP